MARFNPPTRTPSKRALAKRNEELRKERAASRGVVQAKRARRAQLQGDAFSQAHRMLELETGFAWRKRRIRPERYWDERWEFEATRNRASYEDIHEWQIRVQTNRTVASYFESRTTSIMLVIDDQGDLLTFTAAAAGSFYHAMEEMDEKLQEWAGKYGRDAADDPDDTDTFTTVVEVIVFLKRRGVHPQWRSVVRGRAEDRERRRRAPGRS